MLRANLAGCLAYPIPAVSHKRKEETPGIKRGGETEKPDLEGGGPHRRPVCRNEGARVPVWGCHGLCKQRSVSRCVVSQAEADLHGSLQPIPPTQRDANSCIILEQKVMILLYLLFSLQIFLNRGIIVHISMAVWTVELQVFIFLSTPPLR